MKFKDILFAIEYYLDLILLVSLTLIIWFFSAIFIWIYELNNKGG
ncbi:MAG: hypothetical protein V1901_04285 [Patescibacteria group bacterium]